jgi:regulator of replication initiation timing
MSLFKDKQSLTTQIVDTEKMLELASNHPLMNKSLKERLESLKVNLSKLPDVIFEPAIKLLFSGNAVRGSAGIKSSFVGKMITPFQEMIKTQSALVRFGSVAKRGQAKKSPYTELFITSLPIGSFGIELTKLDSQDLFAENDVATAMKQVVGLIKNAAESDELFEAAILKTPKRNLTNLKKFLKEVTDENSFLKLETSELSVEISEEGVRQAYERVAETVDDEQELFISGILRGILLDSEKFEIQDAEGRRISGFISQELTEEELIEFDQKFLNNNCKIHLILHKTQFKTGNENLDYELLGIDSLD